MAHGQRRGEPPPIPYLILLQMGFTLQFRLTLELGGLLHHLFTLIPRLAASDVSGTVYFLWHFPSPSI